MKQEVLLKLNGMSAALGLLDLLKNLVVVLLDKVVVGRLHITVPQDVLHEVRGILVQKSLASLLEDLQHVRVQALVQHLVFKVEVLLVS